MLNWRSRLASQGITWEQLVFQFLIVLLGVYLAIAFEGRAEDRERVEQAHELLERVLEELKLDESHTKEIMAGAELTAVAFDSLLFLAANDPNSHGDEIQSLLSGPLFAIQTVYPRRAAYTTLLSGGFLTAVQDQDLAVRLADLYEHWHPRIEANGVISDRITNDSYDAFVANWDLDRRQFLDTDIEAMVGARNAIRAWEENYCDWYARTLLPEFLGAVEGTRRELESYLER